MERKLYTDDFERLLREKSDEFRMYPSRRIWNSIYNNIHPGKKWPSVAMSIMLITSLLLVGYLNTKDNLIYSSKDPSNTWGDKVTQTLQSQYQVFPDFVKWNKPSSTNVNDMAVSPGIAITESLSSGMPVNSNNPNVDMLAVNGSLKDKTEISPGLALSEKIPFTPGLLLNKPGPLAPGSIMPGETTIDPILINELPGSPLIMATPLYDREILSSPVSSSTNMPVAHQFDKDIIEKATEEKKKAKVEKNAVEVISNEDNRWIEEYAFYNKPAAKKWANKLGWQFYATPSVVYRKLFSNTKYSNPVNPVPFAITGISPNINTEVNHRPSLGLEAGGTLQYSLAKNLKIKGGLQFNYTRYNAIAFQNTHPVATKIALNDFRTNQTYEVYRNTPFSNNAGLSRTALHNETYQLSIPLGIELRLAGKDNLQWNIASAIEPTLLLGGRSYLISSDRRNYVKESSMLNRWNMNASFETFVSYKHNGFTWQLGPRFRTQLFSNNSKLYTVEERLVNYGFKVGVSKIIQ